MGIVSSPAKPLTASLRNNFALGYIITLLVVHSGLLAYSSSVNAPVFDEYGHLPAGIAQWQYDAFDLYCVNPPLVRMSAALPALGFESAARLHPKRYKDLRVRGEFQLGREWVKENGGAVFHSFRVARWACIPFSLIGALVCWRWASDLYGTGAGAAATTLWCFSPLVLGHGSLMTPDVAGASLGIAALYVFWKWLQKPAWFLATLAGIILGVAELTKFTLIILLPLYPLLFLAYRVCIEKASRRQPLFLSAGQLGFLLCLALCVINLGYGFGGTGKRLGDFTFFSSPLTGNPSGEELLISAPANRFRDTLVGSLPIPLPEYYVSGIDLQQFDFDKGWPSYLCGEWRYPGWLQYYCYGLFIKEPLGFWALFVIACLVSAARLGRKRDELVFLIPAASFFILVSLKTGLNHHVRYAFPCLPMMFIFASKAMLIPARLAAQGEQKHSSEASPTKQRWAFCVTACLWLLVVLSAASSLAVYPQSLAYFNEAVGGPTNGYRHLDQSNLDWGQDLFRVKQWSDEHGITLDGFAYCNPYCDVRVFGLPDVEPPEMYQGMATWEAKGDAQKIGIRPGWYAIGATRLVKQYRGISGLRYFERLKPAGYAGYATPIYHVSLDQANAIRIEFGLPELREER